MSFLPERDRDYLKEKGYEYQEYAEGNQRGIILKNWPLPANKFTLDKVDLLVLIPVGYPDNRLDMFYNSPDVHLKQEQKTARAADHPLQFNSIHWQRWSRHLAGDAWRPGIDGIHTFIQAIQQALVEARA